MASDPTIVTKIYEQIPLEAMQQVSDSYMAWYVDRVTRQLDDTMASLRSELRENDTKEASYRPSPQELEAIERLQRSGVTGVDLLDRMVEQGDDWLGVTMRRLDHFERTGLAPKDYSTWCEHALSGAYDWIDHERLATTPGPSSASGGAGGGKNAAAARNAAPASASGGSMPDWLSNRGAARNASPAAPPAPSASSAAGREDGPTAPVPSVPARSNDANYFSSGQPGAAPRPQTPAAQPAAGPDSDPDGRRNIFRIFTN